MARRVLFVLLVLVACVPSMAARVLSYAPYTSRPAFPATQLRTNRYFVLVEGWQPGDTSRNSWTMWNLGINGQLVLYDSKGIEEPRVIYPQDGSMEVISVASTTVMKKEGDEETLAILVQVLDVNTWRFLLSVDNGHTWKTVPLPNDINSGSTITQVTLNARDVGGPFARGRRSPVRSADPAIFPFVVEMRNGLYGVDANGGTKHLFETPGNVWPRLAGSDAQRRRFVVRHNTDLVIVGLDGTTTKIGTIEDNSDNEAWITSDGTVYVDTFQYSPNREKVSRIQNGSTTVLAQASLATDPLALFAVPTYDYDGAWIVQRAAGQTTTLWLHTSAGGMQSQWSDASSPVIQGIHTSASGDKLLVHVARPRPSHLLTTTTGTAMAIWRRGDPAPLHYDEMHINQRAEGDPGNLDVPAPTRGFVHLDVDTIESGAPFVLDAGVTIPPGGEDVAVGEWNIVRSSYRQQLLLPAVGRVPGALGSFWATDVILRNPLAVSQSVEVKYVPAATPSSSAGAQRVVTLAPREIRRYEDVMRTLFGLDSGNGTLLFDPARAVTVTSRTYTTNSKGSFGFGMDAIDVNSTSASSRHPVVISGAFPGASFRTNVYLTDTSGHGTDGLFQAFGENGIHTGGDPSFAALPRTQLQLNNLQNKLALSAGDTGSLLVRASNGGAVVSLFAIDNRTNDPTWFPPDLASTYVRSIPVVGHVDGANGARFRTDLYVVNTSSAVKSLYLYARSWDEPDTPPHVDLLLQPNEARIIHDVLFSLFAITGRARLDYQSTDGSVRVDSRTYSIDEQGGTYGFIVPPLTAFQRATAGDVLEILGTVADDRFRTNIGLIDVPLVPQFGGNPAATIEIIDAKGTKIDSWDVEIPQYRGVQIDDIFRTRALDIKGPALIRIVPVRGNVGAYGCTLDNGTNDALYHPALLAPHD